MNIEVLYKRYILYPTDKPTEPGSVRVQVCSPRRISKLPILLEERSSKNPIPHLGKIIDLVRDEILNRARINVSTDVVFFIDGNEEVKKEYGTRYVKAYFDGGNLRIEGTDTLDF